MSMNAEVKALWVADLRAHPELQGTGELNPEGTHYCCLGRLCVLAEQAGIVKRIPTAKYSSFNNQWGPPADSRSHLAAAVQQWAGITPTQEHNLSVMNDSGYTFTEIADSIEANL